MSVSSCASSPDSELLIFSPARSLNTAAEKASRGGGTIYTRQTRSCWAGEESNWVSSKPGEQFGVLFRFYRPEKAFFRKTWKLPDIEEAK
jgi:hypothetical protein